jgi:hypothetical protein
MSDISVKKILNRIKKDEGLRYDKDAAALLGANNPSKDVANWKARNSVPWDALVQYCEQSGKSLDYLVMGRKVGDIRVAEEAAEYGHTVLQGLDIALFNRLVCLISEQAKCRGITVEPAWLLKSGALLYHQAKTTNTEPDLLTINGMLDLAE